ncbi:hypothetical protein [Rhodanobacter thiooxydans]|uniref:hypothetical protein n=1 Tax=Rhodanobacter thiooxydans TaxID=416169 RepID=UPI000A8F75B1|nr:hypothetical protein [Rhodanobacter thiooxydans]MCW0203549.1 hypothetical protein [Rhodanobacter thiooxydans]
MRKLRVTRFFRPVSFGIKRAVIVGAGIFIIAFGSSAVAGSTTLEASYSTNIQNGWERVERWRDTEPAFTQESFPTDGRGDQSGQRVTFFGSSKPNSSRFLMYYAPGWSSNTKPVPILLVHGANQDADRRIQL